MHGSIIYVLMGKMHQTEKMKRNGPILENVDGKFEACGIFAYIILTAKWAKISRVNKHYR